MRGRCNHKLSISECLICATPSGYVNKAAQMEHDEELLEQLYWEFRSARSTTDERMAFKGEMRFYARVMAGKSE